MDHEVLLQIEGMGIVFFSAKTMEDVKPGTDFLSEEFEQPQQIAQHINRGDITGFCTGSGGDYHLHFRSGQPTAEEEQQFPIQARLGLDVQGGSIQFCDLFWLMQWDADFPEEQVLPLADGYYEMTICTCRPESEIWGDDQTICIYLNRVDQLPELTWQGVPYLFTEEDDEE